MSQATRVTTRGDKSSLARSELRALRSALRLVDPAAPQHGVDQPHQLASREHQRPAMMVPGRLGELLGVVGTELRAVVPHRVGRLDEVVAQVFVAGLGERSVVALELAGLVICAR